MFEDLVHSCLKKIGFSAIPGTKHMWVRKRADGSVDGFICVYVDDFFAVGVAQSASTILEELGKHLKININPPGAPVNFIGNSFTKEGRLIIQSQEHYSTSLPADESKVETPLPVRINERAMPKEIISDARTIRTYRKHLGALNFLARDSRPDAAFAASWLGKQTTKLTPIALRAMSRCLSFVKSNPLSIPLPGCHNESLSIDM